LSGCSIYLYASAGQSTKPDYKEQEQYEQRSEQNQLGGHTALLVVTQSPDRPRRTLGDHGA
jgi:hypothetical protein